MEDRYAVGFVSGWEITMPFFTSLVALVRRDGCDVVSLVSGPNLHRSRNEMARLFLKESEAKALLVIDTDIEFTEVDVDAILAHTEDVVSGVYVDYNGEMIRDGCGFLLIQRHVLERLAPAAFNPVQNEQGEVSGEDVGFRRRAFGAGFAVVVDESIAVGHLKPQILRPAAVPVVRELRELVNA